VSEKDRIRERPESEEEPPEKGLLSDQVAGEAMKRKVLVYAREAVLKEQRSSKKDNSTTHQDGTGTNPRDLSYARKNQSPTD